MCGDISSCSSTGLLPAATDLRYTRLKGTTGSIVRPKVELMTAANDAYQAAMAVAKPNQPPSLIVLALAPELPMPRMMNVIARSRNTSATAAVVRSEATNMYVVKMPHVHR